MAIAGQLIVKMQADIADLKVGIQQANQQLSQFAAKVSSVGDTLRNAFKTGVILQAAREVIQYGLAIAQLMGDIADTAERLGVSTDALQAWQSAARGAGVSSEQMNEAITKFNTTIGKAAEGNTKAIETFQKLGVKILDFRGEVRSTEKLLPEAAAAIDRLGSQSQKSAVLVELFGRSGAKMAAAMKDLGISAEQAIDKFRAKGLLFDPALIKQVDELGDKFVDIGRKFEVAFSNLVIEPLLPALKAIAAVLDAIATTLATIGKLDLGDLIRIAAMFAGGGGAGSMGVEMAKNRAARRQQEEAAAEYGGMINIGRGRPPPDKDPIKKGGGGGKSDIEKAKEELKALTAEAERYGDSIKQIREGRLPNESWEAFSKRLELDLAVAKRIDDIAKKYPKLPAGLRTQLEEEAAAVEQSKFRYAELKKTMADGDTVRKQYGDGVQELSDRLKELDKIQKENIVTENELALARFAAVKKAREDFKQFQDRMIEMKFGTGALELFKAMESELINLGDTMFDIFGKGEQSFKQMVSSMLAGLSKMVFQMLVWTPIVKAFMDLIRGWASGSATPPGLDTSGNPLAGARQHGGPVWPGASFLVGERGPERFVPNVPGTIEPHTMSDGNVNIAIDARGVVTDANDPARAGELARRMKSAVMDVLKNERRPGGLLTQPI